MIARYLGGWNEPTRNVVELQHHTTLDEVCSLVHKVKLQKKPKVKREQPKPPQRTYPFNNRSFPPTPKPINTSMPPVVHKPNSSEQALNPFGKRRCYTCHEFGHIASNYQNQKAITLVEYQVLEEAYLMVEGSDNEVHLMEFEEEFMEEGIKVSCLCLEGL